MPTDVKLIEAVPVLAALDAEDRQKLANVATRVDVSGGEPLFREGEPADEVYFVVSGVILLHLRVVGRQTLTVLSVGPGELVGWSGLLPQGRVASATVAQDATLLRFHGPTLLELCEEDHDIGFVLMRTVVHQLAQRLHDTRLQLLNLVGQADHG